MKIIENQSLLEIFAREYGEKKMSVIFHIFHKNKGNSMAIDRIFRGNMGDLSHFYPSYLSCKGLFLFKRVNVWIFH
jgi:hypothetical protein